MGGIEDEEPPLKRIKVSSPKFNKFSENRAPVSAVGAEDILMAKTVTVEEGETIGSKNLIRKMEFVRIITQALYSLGYQRAGALLEEESGIRLQSQTVTVFRQQILDGKWDESIVTLRSIDQLEESVIKSSSFTILEQKFFDLLQNGKTVEAMFTLRSEISPLKIKTRRVHELATLLVFPSFSQEAGPLNNDNSTLKQRLKVLQDIQKLLPPSVMIPEQRLECLVEQALSVQREACIFHNSLDPALCLYTDHQCGLDQIPTKTLQVLESHENEVWFVQFSNSGKYMASASNDCTAIIWQIDDNGEFSVRHKLTGHKKPVLSVSWSPDDKLLLTCGQEEVVNLWDAENGKVRQTFEKQNIYLTTCGWFPDGKRIVTGGNDKCVYIFDLYGNELDTWKGGRGPRITDLAVTADGKQIIGIWGEKDIMVYDLETKTEKPLLNESSGITSFCLSRDSRYLLVNLVVSKEIHLWDVASQTKLMKYQGHRQDRYVIRSCFGGSDLAFVVSGSEDSQVYIWHRGNGELLTVLPGHSGTVNCVSWNPVNPHMFASASDDRTIRIWGVESSSSKCSSSFGNGVIPLENGASQ